jgi:O-acetyl-ADP-ribose deacetylase (regulator of RNase III)
MGYTTTVGRATFHDILLGSIFDSGADVLVCPVNCVPGVMGAGLALEFAKRWPSLKRCHFAACSGPGRRLAPGVTIVTAAGPTVADPLVMFFPTKRHWRDRSRLEDIAAGLREGVPYSFAALRPKKSIAFPAIGCGLGRLRWEDVRPLIVEAMAPIDITVMLYAPKEGSA